MALVECHECGQHVSTEAKVCPACGAPVRSSWNRAAAIGGVAVALLIVWYFFGGGLEQEASRNVQDINKQVATDTVQRYEIAKRRGAPMDVCMHAGLAAASFLQAKDEPNYRKWKQIESADCAAAGMPVPVAAAAPGAPMPVDVVALVQREEALNDVCRGGSGDDAKTEQACADRDQLFRQITARGWCYGHEPQTMTERSWELCR
jgi:hypothetical protein